MKSTILFLLLFVSLNLYPENKKVTYYIRSGIYKNTISVIDLNKYLSLKENIKTIKTEGGYYFLIGNFNNYTSAKMEEDSLIRMGIEYTLIIKN